MAVLAQHLTSITLDVDPPVHLNVTRQKLTMDAEWSPYVQAQLVCALGDAEVATIDPTVDDVWATITTRRLLGRIDRLGDLTRKYRGKTLGDITAEFAGDTLADITLAVYHDYTDPGVPLRSQDRTFDLMLRDLTINWKDGEAELELASGEALLFDDAWVDDDYTIPGSTVRDVIVWVLNRSGLTLAADSAGIGIPAADLGDARIWQSGQTAWDVLQQICYARGYLLWCDENGIMQCKYSARPTGSSRTLRSSGADRSIVNAVEKRSRDGNWYTAVMLVWNRDGVTTRGFATTPGQPIKLYVREYPAGFGPPWFPDDLAASVLQRVRNRGSALELLAVSDYAITPMDNVTYNNPRTNLTGQCVAVEWAWPEDEMSVRLRDVEP